MLSTQSKSTLRNAIVEMTKHYTTATTTVTDIHFQVNGENGNISIFDDDDKELSQAHIPEWENCTDDKHTVVFEKEIRNILTNIQKEGILDNMNILKPYSCLLVDEEKETIVDLLYMDDNTYIINDELLKGFDEEMEDFLKHLLEE